MLNLLLGILFGIMLVAWVIQKSLDKDNPYKKHRYLECLVDLIIKIYDRIKEKIDEIQDEYDEHKKIEN